MADIRSSFGRGPLVYTRPPGSGSMNCADLNGAALSGSFQLGLIVGFVAMFLTLLLSVAVRKI